MTINLRLALVLCGIILLGAFKSYAEIGGYTEQIRLQKMREFMQSMDRPLLFYGRVVDDSDTPVPDAMVKFQIGQSVGIKKVRVSTNNQGLFEISGEVGNGLSLKTIEKVGYEYSHAFSGTRYSYDNDGTFVPDRNNPVVFKVRKKLPPTVVVPGEISVVFTNKKKVKYYEVDLIEMADGGPYELKEYHGNHAHADLKARLEHDEGGIFYTFIVQTPDADSGMIALDQPLYAPPADGYQKEYRVILSDGKKKETWLYVKSRNGQLYSRLKIKFAVEEGEAFFAAEVLSNPLGERNFDYDADKYGEWREQKIKNRKYMAPRTQ